MKKSLRSKECNYPNCGLGVKARGYCNGHYQQFKSGRELKPLQLKTGVNGQVLGRSMCSFPSCVGTAASWGLCDGHYQQRRAGKELVALQQMHEVCTVPGCVDVHEAKGYCRSHYDKWRTQGDPLAITRKDPSRVEHVNGCLHVFLGGIAAAGAVTLVSVEDGKLVEGHSWWMSGEGYVSGKPEGRRSLLHRYLMDLSAEDPRQVDHINGNRLDNRRENLRIVTFPQQMQNKKPWAESGHRNCYWEEEKQLWRVIVTKDGQKHQGGRHKSLDDAREAAAKLRGELFTHANEERVNVIWQGGQNDKQ